MPRTASPPRFPQPIIAARRVREEAGQVVAIVAVMLAVLLGAAALTVDVGIGYFSQRSLQASADAAALAGAQGLPSAQTAQSLAMTYSGSAGDKNARSNVPNVATTVSFECLPPGATCTSNNAIVVAEKAHVNSFFARVFGVHGFNVAAQATACSQGSTLVYLVSSNGPCPTPVGFSSTQHLTPNDSALVTGSSGGPTPTGTVLFRLFSPSDATCSGTPAYVDTETLRGGQANTGNASLVASIPAGTWRWSAHYSGDSTYQALDSACGIENLTIANG